MIYEIHALFGEEWELITTVESLIGGPAEDGMAYEAAVQKAKAISRLQETSTSISYRA